MRGFGRTGKQELVPPPPETLKNNKGIEEADHTAYSAGRPSAFGSLTKSRAMPIMPRTISKKPTGSAASSISGGREPQEPRAAAGRCPFNAALDGKRRRKTHDGNGHGGPFLAWVLLYRAVRPAVLPPLIRSRWAFIGVSQAPNGVLILDRATVGAPHPARHLLFFVVLRLLFSD